MCAGFRRRQLLAAEASRFGNALGALNHQYLSAVNLCRLGSKLASLARRYRQVKFWAADEFKVFVQRARGWRRLDFYQLFLCVWRFAWQQLYPCRQCVASPNTALSQRVADSGGVAGVRALFDHAHERTDVTDTYRRVGDSTPAGDHRNRGGKQAIHDVADRDLFENRCRIAILPTLQASFMLFYVADFYARLPAASRSAAKCRRENRDLLCHATGWCVEGLPSRLCIRQAENGLLLTKFGVPGRRQHHPLTALNGGW